MENITGFVNSSFFVNDGLAKAILSMTPCFLFLYVNIVMLITLRSKELFCETPRYILFSSLLFSDSVQLAFTIVFYILYHSTFAVESVHIVGYGCFLIYLVSRVINIISPLYLGLMSLERYVAICFPLRHAQIVDKRRTTASVGVVWILSLIFWTAELTTSLMFEVRTQTRQRTCSDFIVFQMQISFSINTAFTATVFALVSVVIIYTYVAVVMVAMSTSSDKTSVSKAHRTILLHMVQFGLYLLSILFGVIRRTLAMSRLDPEVIGHLNYVLFLGLNILPRCLSPLIYGVRDKTFSAFFKCYFLFCIKSKVQPSGLHAAIPTCRYLDIGV
ncbi:odorant receptor 131-2-like [Alosa sapidissima]|uniref:odorant receptor 131-2-like n=1 Tax=Alosa sapidissima TaxID=34773 RepID=UPI001C08E21A|nr:odorant receptor 131-2-like [Alosa sapidissima]